MHSSVLGAQYMGSGVAVDRLKVRRRVRHHAKSIFWAEQLQWFTVQNYEPSGKYRQMVSV